MEKCKKALDIAFNYDQESALKSLLDYHSPLSRPSHGFIDEKTHDVTDVLVETGDRRRRTGPGSYVQSEN